MVTEVLWILDTISKILFYVHVESLIRFLFIEFLKKYSTTEYETKIYVVIQKVKILFYDKLK